MLPTIIFQIVYSVQYLVLDQSHNIDVLLQIFAQASTCLCPESASSGLHKIVKHHMNQEPCHVLQLP